MQLVLSTMTQMTTIDRNTLQMIYKINRPNLYNLVFTFAFKLFHFKSFTTQQLNFRFHSNESEINILYKFH